MTQTEALKQALEALEWINRVNAMDYEHQQKARESLNAIYEALAQPECNHEKKIPMLACVKCGALCGTPAEREEPVAIVHIKDECLAGSHRDNSKPFPDGQYGLWPISTPPQPDQDEKFCDSNCVWTDHHPDCKLAQPDVDRRSTESKETFDQQEPVATVAEVHMSRYTIEWTNGPLPEGTPLYTTPPQRKPLTDEEIENLWQNTSPYYDHQDFARAIEAAHGIKE